MDFKEVNDRYVKDSNGSYILKPISKSENEKSLEKDSVNKED